MEDLDKVAETSARGSFHLFIGNLLSESINAVGIIIVARLLTAEDMGIYSLSLVMPTLFALFSGLGLNPAMTRFLAKYKSEERWSEVKRATLTGFLFQGGLSCLLAAVLYITADFLAHVVMKRPELTSIMRITALLVIMQAVYTMATSVFTGLERMDIRGIAMVVLSTIKASSAILLVSKGSGVKGLIYGHLLGVGAASAISIILIYAILRKKERKPMRHSEVSLQGMIRFGFPLFLSTFLVNISVGYQGLLLAWFTDNAAIGNLDISKKFLSLVSLFTLPVISVIYPAFSKFDINKQAEEIRLLYRSSVRYSTLIIIPVITILIILSRQGIEFLFGTRYELAPLYLSLTLLQFLAVGVGSLSVFGFLNSQGDTRTSFRLTAVKIFLNMLLGTIFIWIGGVPGLLIGLFLSAIAGNAFTQYTVYRKYNMGIDLTHTIRVAAFSILAAILTHQITGLIQRTEPLTQMVIGGTFFLVTCLILAPISQAITDTDIKILTKILRKSTIIYPVIAPFLTLETRIIKTISHSKK